MGTRLRSQHWEKVLYVTEAMSMKLLDSFCLFVFCDFFSVTFLQKLLLFFQSPATSVSILHNGKDESRPLIVKATPEKPGRWGGQHNECSQVCKD